MIDESREKQPKRPQSGEQSGNGSIAMDSETRKHIGRMLKATYDDIASEPVPDKFLDLLKQLEKAEPGKQ